MQTRNEPSEIKAAASRLISAGLSVISIKPDSSKSPPIPWKEFQRRQATEEELTGWFTPEGRTGLAIIGGKVSGGLEILDFDDDALYAPWCELVESEASGLLNRLPKVKTPEGVHVYCRSEGCEGNQKLAQAFEDGQPKTLIETRGEGGYVIAPPSPGKCHPSGKPYRIIHGSLEEIPHLSREERQILLSAARSFNSYIRPERFVSGQPPTKNGAGDRPGDDFNHKAGWGEILEPHGWVLCFSQGGEHFWRRPGKEGPGWSATTNYQGSNLLYIFSTNAVPFDFETAYSKFAAFALLEHGGDFTAAAIALSRSGYGNPNGGGPPFPKDEDLPPGNGADFTSSSGDEEARRHEEEERLGMQGEEKVQKGEFVPAIVSASSVKPEDVRYEWYPYLPLGKLVIFGGDSGTGKTFVALSLAASNSLGSWPFYFTGKDSLTSPGRTLFFSTEDGIADTLVPRLINLGANLDLISFVEGKKDWKGNLHHIVLNDSKIIARSIQETNARLVIFDPFQDFLPKGTKINEMETVRPVLSTLINTARETGCVIILVGHLNKTKHDTAAYKFIGSVDWFAAARSAMLVVKDPDNAPDGRIFYQVKNSLVPTPPRDVLLD